MKKFIFILAALAFAYTAGAWPVQTNRFEVQIGSQFSGRFAIPQGESRVLEVAYVNSGAPVSLDGMTADYLYRAPGSTGAWYAISGTTTNGSALFLWDPSRDEGSLQYGGWVRLLTGSTTVIYRAKVDLGMIETPGFSPNATNLSVFLPTGPPGPQGVQGPAGPQGNPGTDGVDGADGVSAAVVTGMVTAIVAPYTNHQSRADNPHGVTPSQIGAVSTNDARYLASLTNAAAFATAAQGTLADTAWQNPANATNWTWTSNGKEITLTSYAGPNDVVIPDMLDGLPVTGFGTTFSPEYMGTTITSVGGGANITSIGSDAFLYCDGLTSVALPNITSIGEYTFYKCTDLTSVALPNATSIGNSAFYNCSSLTSVSFPQATSIGNSAFYGCSSLTSVALPNATSIGVLAFEDCPDLTIVYMGQNSPAESEDVFFNNTNATIYVTNPQATGWTNTWNGRPVVRMGLSADSLTLNGDTITNWPSGGGTSSTTNWIAANVIPQTTDTNWITSTTPSPFSIDMTGRTTIAYMATSFPSTVTGMVIQAVQYRPNGFSFGVDSNTISGTPPTAITNGWNIITIIAPHGATKAEVR